MRTSSYPLWMYVQCTFHIDEPITGRDVIFPFRMNSNVMYYNHRIVMEVICEYWCICWTYFDEYTTITPKLQEYSNWKTLNDIINHEALKILMSTLKWIKVCPCLLAWDFVINSTVHCRLPINTWFDRLNVHACIPSCISCFST